jgi:hypothetical protein
VRRGSEEVVGEEKVKAKDIDVNVTKRVGQSEVPRKRIKRSSRREREREKQRERKRKRGTVTFVAEFLVNSVHFALSSV